MTSSQPQKGHVDALTGVRAFAAGWVVLYHVWLFSGKDPVALHAFGLTVNLTPIISMGWFGVDVFFVLSGFVLTWQALLQARRAPHSTAARFWHGYGEFIYRRILRVYPVYYACLAVLLPLAWLHVYGNPPDVADVALHLVMFHNVAGQYVSTINGVFWSLPFEWQFYLLFPLLVLLILRGQTLWLLLLGVAASAVSKIIVLSGGPDSHSALLLAQLPMRLDAFVIGMVAAKMAYSQQRDSHWRVWSFWIGASGLMGAAQYFGSKEILWWSWDSTPFVRAAWVDSAVALLLIGLSGDSHVGARLFNNRAMVWLGTISYSIYIWHFPLLEVLAKLQATAIASYLTSSPFVQLLVLGIPVTLAVSAISYYVIERPFLTAASPKLSGAVGRVASLLALGVTGSVLLAISWYAI
jgi:peptidoglycan/LPS O-acetylase OafA/YrhL